jgi:hypothetical protein
MDFSKIVFILFLLLFFWTLRFVFITQGTCSLCVLMPVEGQCYVDIHKSMVMCLHYQLHLHNGGLNIHIY